MQKHPSGRFSARVFSLFFFHTSGMGSFPKQCGNTWGSYGNGKRPGWLDRGGGRVVHRFHRYFRGFVPACSFRV